jgi:peptidyl-prolyl cis-trans isomerase SurA
MRILKATIFMAVALVLLAVPHPSPAFKNMGSSDQSSSHQSMTSMAATQHQDNQDAVVARVNGVEITMGPLMGTVMEIVMRSYGKKDVTKELAQRIRREALEQLAIEELAFQRAQAIGIVVSPDDINKRITRLQLKAGGEEILREQLASQNKSIDDLKTEILRFMAVEKALAQEIDSKIIVEEQEINEIFQANRAQFITPEQVVVSDLVFFLDPSDEASRNKVINIRKKIIEELNSNPAKASPDGFIVNNWISITRENTPGLYETAMKLKPGELSEPLILDETYHLVKLEMYTPSSEIPEKEAKAKISRKLKSDRKKQALADWRQGLLKEAKIEIVHELLQ